MGRRLVFTRSREAEEAARILVEALGLSYIDVDRVFVTVSRGSSTRAFARIWGLPSPFVRLGVCKPMYVVELVAENLRGAGCDVLVETLIHELLHIPRSFSGGLRSHGEWSRPSNVRRLARSLPREVRLRVCALLRRALEGGEEE
ncbi:MAG: metallopeptidase [Crenarchaeota archaeon]|nr:metallopeptidase [Thermoproteota archaeon]